MADLFDVVVARKLSGGSGGGSSITVEPLSVTENDTYTAPTGKAYSPVTVNVSGGGSGDFSTATVTVVNNTNTGVNILGAIIDHDAINYVMPIFGHFTHAIEAILYKAEGLIVVDNKEVTITVSGDAELDETTVFITGDCTITIS